MSRKAKFLMLVLAVLAVAGCASRPINERITQADPKSGYRPYLLIPKRQNNDPHTLFVLAFSGVAHAPRRSRTAYSRSSGAPRSSSMVSAAG